MQLQLTEAERVELAGLVREAFAESNPELRRAMGHDYRDRVRERRLLLESLLKRLEAAPLATA